MPRKTLLMEVIESELKISLSAWIHRKAKLGWTQRAMANELGVGQSTMSHWCRMFGYSPYQAAQVAWEHDLILTTEPDSARVRPIYRRRLRAM